MAKIREYSQQVGAESELPLAQVRRQAFASDFGGEGPGLQVLGRAFQQVGSDVVATTRILKDNEARQEVTRAAVDLSKLNAEATLELQNASMTAVPGDKEFATRFTTGLAGRLEKLREGYQTGVGQQTFDRHAAELSSHFVIAAGTAQARLAGIAAKQDYITFLDASRNTVLQDPSQFGRALDNSVALLNDPNGIFARIPADQREVLTRQTRAEIALSAVQGDIRADPAGAKARLETGAWDPFLDADKKQALLRLADVGIRGQEVEIRRQEAVAEKARKDEIKDTQNGFILKLSENKLTTKEILDSNLDPVGEGSKEHFLTVLKAKAKDSIEKPVTKEPSVFLNAVRGIRSGRITEESQIEALYAKSVDRGRGISWEDVKSLRTELADRRTPEGERLGKVQSSFIEGISKQIDKSNPLMGNMDPSGHQKLYEFEYFVQRKVEQYRKANKDPYELFDPSSKDYLGKPETLAGFQKTMQESIRDVSENLRRQPGATGPGAAVPAEKQRKPGESITDYLKRTK